MTTENKITGYHVFFVFLLAFATIVAVNLTLAFNAVKSFPGLEVRNSYIASQSFEVNRAAQLALGWEVTAKVHSNEIFVSITKNGQPVVPVIEMARLGRATSVAEDQDLHLTYSNGVFQAPVPISDGNWNLRLRARAQDGTVFAQRIIVEMAP